MELVPALAGCTDFNDARRTTIHVSMDSWIGSYSSMQNSFAAEYPQIAAEDLGSMGYSGQQSIFVSQAVHTAARPAIRVLPGTSYAELLSAWHMALVGEWVASGWLCSRRWRPKKNVVKMVDSFSLGASTSGAHTLQHDAP
ncbi:unnamed protein product [Durusdinium trenchii]|uniref:Phospholipase B-like n=1 Tax=Durusdinium trenchii TaxID=1381693 RepID=A0ABP0PKE6_9DINO